jgi:hypothetical protein
MTDLPSFTALKDQAHAGARGLGESGLPVDYLIDAATWLASFAAGECGYGGLGPDAAGILAIEAVNLLDRAIKLAGVLRPWPPAAARRQT